MHKLSILIKSFYPDLKSVKRLLDTIDQFNKDLIPVYVSVNDSDFDIFKAELSKYSITLLKDSDIIRTNIEPGWRYQQIIKSQFYRYNVCENYLCVDSDSFFIRDFYIADFMYNDDTPYTIMDEAKEHLDMMGILGFDLDKLSIKETCYTIRAFLGTENTTTKVWDFGPSPYLWSNKIWKHFNEVFLASRNQTFEEFFNEIDKIVPPAESLIYGEYLLKSRLIEIIPIQGFFKVYHYKRQFKLERKYYDIDRLKKIYMGVIFQSNWANKKNFWSFLKRKY